MAQYLPDEFDLENFDFRVGKNVDAALKRAKKRKDDFNFGKDFNIAGSELKPSRQTKKARENIKVQVVNNTEVEKEKEQVDAHTSIYYT